MGYHVSLPSMSMHIAFSNISSVPISSWCKFNRAALSVLWAAHQSQFAEHGLPLSMLMKKAMKRECLVWFVVLSNLQSWQLIYSILLYNPVGMGLAVGGRHLCNPLWFGTYVSNSSHYSETMLVCSNAMTAMLVISTQHICLFFGNSCICATFCVYIYSHTVIV